MNPQPDRFFHFSLIFLVALNLVPHYNDYSIPTLSVGGLCLCWRLLYEYQIIPLPNFWTKLGLVTTLVYLIYINYGGIFGLKPGSALLICSVSLKLIDRVGYRDAMVLLFLNFMLLLARFLESQTLGITIFAAFDLIVTTALLVQLHNGSHIEFNIKSLLKTGTKIFLQITPFMVLLFFVFPRFSVNFIGFKVKKNQAKGFSENLEPGSVSRLVKSDQVAFHAKFQNSPPPPSEMYWRGAVFNINKGMKWKRVPLTKENPKAPEKKPEDILKQEILMEPLFNDWLFAIDRPYRIQHKNKILQKFTKKTESSNFILQKDHNRKFIYDAYSSKKTTDFLTEKNKKIYLQSPVFNDPRIHLLIRKIKKGAETNRKKALNLMIFYQKQFFYTLNPGVLEKNSLAEFLFEKKKGFCEHFATSFAALMRMAGVPSRVIVGFHGGVKSRMSNYYLVTGKDAHAWTEIWSENKKKWLRFDPTIMVSPLRLQLGGQIYHSMTETDLREAQNKGNDLLKQFEMSWLKKIQLTFDALKTRWNLFLLKYDYQGQIDFFEKLGFKNVNQNILLIISLLLLLVFFLIVRLKSQTPGPKKSVEEKAYFFLREQLTKKGIEKQTNEGPSDFLFRCQKELPDLEDKLETFRKAYLNQHYGHIKSNYDFNKVKNILKTL